MIKPNYFLIALILLFGMGKINATTYYVDSDGGNDANPGKTQTAAWSSLSKVNSFKFSFGDTISFKCGDRFSGTTITGKSNITFNSYGTGARPVIDGQSLYEIFIFSSNTNVKLNGLKIVNGTPYNISMGGCNFITIESCNIDSSKGAYGLDANIYTGGGHDITIRNSTISFGEQSASDGNHGYYLDATDNVLMEYDTLDGNHTNLRIGFTPNSNYDSSNHINNWADNLIVRYCVIKNATLATVGDDGSFNAQFYYNVFQSANDGFFHPILDLFTEPGYGSVFPPRHSKYYNNTFIHYPRESLIWINNDNGANPRPSDIDFKNNIFYYVNASDNILRDEISTPAISDWVFTNNLYYCSNGKYIWQLNNTNSAGLATWKTRGYDANSIIANPLFTNFSVGDYSLQNGSPAINTGTFVGLATDIKGNPVPTYSPDIGAYQHINTQNIFANIKVFLEGLYSNGSMPIYFNSHKMISLTQPYNSSPWNYMGSESVSSIPSNIVDWILVELRSTTANYSLVASRAAFLKNDGTIVDLDGFSPLRFNNISSGNYYIVIKYINTIETWSKDGGVLFTNNTASYDFTSAQSQAYGNNLIQVGSKWCIYSGDIDQNGIIDTQDLASINNDNDNFTYHMTNDINGDGMVDLSDLIIADCNKNNHIAKIVPPNAP